MLFLLFGLVSITDVPCQSTPYHLLSVAPLTSEYTHYVKTTNFTTPDVPSHTRIGRRNVQVSTLPPISFINMTRLNDPMHMWVAGIAWKLTKLLFLADSDQLSISIVTESGTTHPTPSTILLGTANPSTRVITLYVDNMPNSDAMLIVLLHEMFHLMGYSTLSSPGSASFRDRTNALTLLYNSSRIDNCVREKQGYTGTGSLYSDADRSHWNMSLGDNRLFDPHDLMMPILAFTKSAISVCTTQNVIESRPGWRDALCFSDADCQLTVGYVCTKLGNHWISVCRPSSHAIPEAVFTARSIRYIVLTYIGTIKVFWILTLQCRKRHHSTT